MGCSNYDKVDEQRSKNRISYIKCTYYIYNKNFVQIINNKDGNAVNEEIESKIKIMNGDKIERLTFMKKFDKIGINIIYFIIEKNLNNTSFMFSKCSSLKEIEFISFDTTDVTNMNSMFKGCYELEYLDLTTFNTTNVNDMGFMFQGCYKLKGIKGINNFNTINVVNMNSMFKHCDEL